ncbi:hypothetical protein BTM25_17620 [Actinomadura rubteroloni]|uniref:2TM domain-containing protein n=1 Tax=Actinomadura rubteroloni TaxID=1926885 RepID=A0A2P4UQN9_9ACTN|nr:hypothetical protein [Actinomadura rubteroloni]POM27349.1 hypothetical protein BTM25_17620 [Actinomadura rubteroloni]
MVVVLIVACEVAFWLLLGLGLTARYLLRARRLGAGLLLCVPLADAVLLAASVVDLRTGAEGSPAHGLAAIYLGVSIAFGHQMIQWADQRFAHRFAGGPAPGGQPKAGRAHAARERRQWLRHLLAYAVAADVLGLLTLLVGDVARMVNAWAVMGPWGIILVIDFLISFSYTITPRKG